MEFKKGDLVMFTCLIKIPSTLAQPVDLLRRGDLGIYQGIDHGALHSGFHRVYWQRVGKFIGVFCTEFEIFSLKEDEDV